MNFRASLKKLFASIAVEARTKPGGRGSDCGPGNHRHPDAFQNKCHPMTQKHKRKFEPKHNSPNPSKNNTVKKLKL